MSTPNQNEQEQQQNPREEKKEREQKIPQEQAPQTEESDKKETDRQVRLARAVMTRTSSAERRGRIFSQETRESSEQKTERAQARHDFSQERKVGIGKLIEEGNNIQKEIERQSSSSGATSFDAEIANALRQNSILTATTTLINLAIGNLDETQMNQVLDTINRVIIPRAIAPVAIFNEAGHQIQYSRNQIRNILDRQRALEEILIFNPFSSFTVGGETTSVLQGITDDIASGDRNDYISNFIAENFYHIMNQIFNSASERDAQAGNTQRVDMLFTRPFYRGDSIIAFLNNPNIPLPDEIPPRYVNDEGRLRIALNSYAGYFDSYLNLINNALARNPNTTITTRNNPNHPLRLFAVGLIRDINDAEAPEEKNMDQKSMEEVEETHEEREEENDVVNLVGLAGFRNLSGLLDQLDREDEARRSAASSTSQTEENRRNPKRKADGDQEEERESKRNRGHEASESVSAPQEEVEEEVEEESEEQRRPNNSASNRESSPLNHDKEKNHQH